MRPTVTSFPPTRLALRDPNGLLAVGGDLSADTLIEAYSRGIFPWFEEGEPVLWWTPDPRSVLLPGQIRISRSLRRSLRRGGFTVTFDHAFEAVMRLCAEPREADGSTWITEDMLTAYCTLHRAGHAHSVETWADGELVGGLYGVALGQVFFGESMFSRRSDASKVALASLCERLPDLGIGLIDCQVETAHLTSLGAVNIPRDEFESLLKSRVRPLRPGSWA